MLLERQAELARIADLVDGPHGAVVTIRGEAGIGKSTLVEAMSAHLDHVDVVVGRCDDLSTPQPLGPFWDMAETEPDLVEPVHAGDRPAVTRRLLDLLARRLRKTMVIVEDMQWADDATIDTVKSIGRRIRSTNGLLVLTYRDTDVDDRHPLRGLLGDLPPSETVRIRLGPLGTEGVGELLGSSDVDAAEATALTGGNPLLVVELARSQDGDGSSLEDLVRARLNRLDDPVRALVTSLAVIPGDIPLALATSVVDDLGHDLPGAERHGFLTSNQTTIRFRHELIRRAIELALPSSERVALNRRILRHLAADADSSIVAHHAREAGDVERLVRAVPIAGRHAAALGAHRQALAHYRDLDGHLDAISSDERARVLEDWALEEFYAHDLQRSVDLARQAADTWRSLGDRSGEARATARLATFHWFAGSRADAVECLDRASGIAESAVHPSALAEVVETRAYLAMMRGDLPGAASAIDSAFTAATAAGDERLTIRALNSRGTTASLSRYHEGMALLDETRARASNAGLWYEEARALLNAAWSSIEHRDLARAEPLLDQVMSLAGRHDLGAAEHYGLALRVRMLDLRAEWAEAVSLADRVIGEGGIAEMTVRPAVASIATRRGDADAARLTDSAWSEAITEEFQRIGPAACAVAEHAWATGTTVDASKLENALLLGLSSGFTWTTGQLAAWLWRLGLPTPATASLAAPYAALLDGDIESAVAEWEQRNCPYEHALTLAAGDTSDRLRAVDSMESLGATAIAAHLRRELRKDGIDVPRGRGHSTRMNPVGLTARQMEVLQLLGEGLPNADIGDRLFVSGRTVESHVSAILAKLGVADRHEATERARATGLID